MSEKRFKVDYEVGVLDTKTNEIVCDTVNAKEVVDLLNEQQVTINKQEEIIKSQDMEISRQYNLCLAMSGVLREEFGVYDVFNRTKDRKID